MPEPQGIAPDGERIAALEAEMENVRTYIAAILESQKKTEETIAKASGGLRVIVWLGGLCIGGGLLRLLSGFTNATSSH